METVKNKYVKAIIISLTLIFCVQHIQADVTKTVGATGADYITLKAAFDAINAGTIKTGVITLQIIANTTETATARLNASGSGSAVYSSVHIYPTVTDVTISGNINSSLIYFVGAANVTIDGRLNATGSTKDLTITNPNSGSYAATIRLINSSQSNTIKYCTLKGSASTSTGILWFSSSSSGTGNNNNIVEYCDITNSSSVRAVNAVFSKGTAGLENKFNTIRYNNFYNLFRTNATSYGIRVSTLSSDWTISNNSFYETDTFIPTGAFNYYPVYVSVGNNHLIDSNYFGGTAPACAGSAMTTLSNFRHYYAAIHLSGGATNKSIVSNNIIRNINYTSGSNGPWNGIFINSGNADVIANTIGDEIGTSSITITTPVAVATSTISGGAVATINVVNGGSGYTSPPTVTFSASGATIPATATANLTSGVVTSITLHTGGVGYTSAPTVYMNGASTTISTSNGIVQNSTGILNVSNNKIGSIRTVGTDAYSHCFQSIFLKSLNTSAVTNISNNLVGSLSTSNSIHVSSTAASSLQRQDVYGIYSTSQGTTTIVGNTIANLTNDIASTNISSRARGIQTTSGSNFIQDNTVRNLSIASAGTGKKGSATMIGISQTSTVTGKNQTVSKNTVYDISNTNASAAVNVNGIYFTGPTTATSAVNANFVYNITASSSNVLSELNGICLFNGITTTSNNIVTIGDDVTAGYLINGIWEEGSSSSTNTIYFNTVYVGGIASGVTSNTAAVWSSANSSTRNIRNNLFVNNRSNGNTGKHYSIYLTGLSKTTIDYNDYFCPNGVLGRVNTADKSTLPLWKAITLQDINSFVATPQFANQGGNSIDDYYISALLYGVAGTGVTNDYNDVTRNATPKLGALETSSFTWKGAVSTDFATAENWIGGVVPADGADITLDASPDNDCVLDKNRIVKRITSGQNSKRLVLNGKKLTLTGSLVLSSGAQLDATATASHIEFQGAAAQSIPSGAFLNSAIDSLSIKNANGLTLNGDFTIEKGLSLGVGNFSIGSNTLTLNGVITTAAGTITGGSTSNMIIGGYGTSTNIPALTLNNLTINRTSGIDLAGNLNIAGTLTLTSGTLTVGANTLTIAINVPVRTNGNIDASNAGCTVVFTNSSAIILPSSLFKSNTLNNITINSSGGISSAGDLTVNGVLNLQKDNPSATKGSLDMWDGSVMKTLTMGANATTVGIGDVTGIIRRTSFTPNVVYTFGNPYTTVTFPDAGTLPTNWEFKVEIGTAPNWKSTAIKRTYDIIRTGGSGSLPTVKLHYKDAELNGNSETRLVFFGYVNSLASVNEFGRINSDETTNWVSLSGAIDFTSDTFGEREWTLSPQEASVFTWLGTAAGHETEWNWDANWSGGVKPSDTGDVIIPSGCANYPTLPTSVTMNTITIEEGAVVNAHATTTNISINGGGSAWFNRGTFNPGTSNVVFSNAAANMTGVSDFYSITINASAKLTLTTNSHLNIIYSIINNGTFDATLFPNTVDFSGANQTIINPNGATAGYFNLLVSGSGTKTMPSTALKILNNFTVDDAASVTSGSAMTIESDVNITENAAWNTGNYNHIIKGNFINNGTFTAATNKSITFSGTGNQIYGGSNTTIFTNLILNNSDDLGLTNHATITENLTLTAGNLVVNESILGINGTISRSNGQIEVSPLSSLSFGGTSSLVLNNDLFLDTVIIKNLIINRSGGVSLGNQNFTVTDSISLDDGTFTLLANSLIMLGNKFTRNTGSINASNVSATIEFANSETLTLPTSVFSASVNNLLLSGIGGITSPSDFTVNGILNLQAENPSDTKGLLDMWDNTDQKTLTMGVSAITVGLGDVTGIIRRTSFVANTAYTFGNQFSFITFDNGGTLPTEVKFKVNIGTAPSWKPNAILRHYELIRTGGVGCTASLSAHYLDSELNGIDENKLVLWNYTAPSTVIEYGSATRSSVENWATINYVNFLFFPTSFGEKGQTLGASELTSNTWDGSDNTLWDDWHNWSGNVVPNSTSNIIIPDVSTTLYSPILSASTEIKTLSIEPNGTLQVSGSPTLTVNGANGAWSNEGGTFIPATGTVAFSNTAATISGSTIFHNISINTNSTLWMTLGSTMKIGGEIVNNGNWRTVINGSTTVEYNGGNQTVIIPNSTTNRYYNLTLSGSGIKTLPATALEIVGDLSISGAATTTTTNDLSIGKDLNIANSANITIETATAINVTRNINNSVGETGLYIKSSSSYPNGTLTFNNASNNPISATVEMYSKASKPTASYKWQFFGIPLRTMPASPTFDGSYVRIMNETDSPTHWLQLNQAGVPSSFVNLNSFSGYQITQLSPKTIYFRGVLENKNFDSGQLSYTTGKSYPGQHLIGNPYTAAIEISKIEFGSTDAGIIENTVYLYNTGSYNDWSTAGSVSAVESNLAGQYISIPINVADRGLGIPSQIPSMQAFLVRVMSSNSLAWVKFPYSSTGTTVKNSTMQRASSAEKISTRINVNGTKFSDVMWLISEPSCSRNFENGWDGYKFIGTTLAPQIYSVETCGNLQVNSVDDLNNTTIAFKSGEDENYTLTFTHQNVSAQYPQLYLQDLVKNVIVDITQSGSTYSFTASQNAAAVNRFKITTTPGISTETHQVENMSLNVSTSKQTIIVDNKNNYPGDLYIYDLSGRLLLTEKFNDNCVTTICTSLKAGIYLYKVMILGCTYVDKTLIQLKE